MLEKVSETGPAGFFILRADVIPGIDRNYRRRLVFVKDDTQTVLQLVFFDLEGGQLVAVLTAR